MRPAEYGYGGQRMLEMDWSKTKKPTVVGYRGPDNAK